MQQPDCNKKITRFSALDGIRGILAITVMLNHFIGAATGWDDFRPFSGAYISVIYFFMMSGFVLTHSNNEKKGIFKYALTRFARLWPLHMITATAMIGIYYHNFITGQYYPGMYVFSFKLWIENLSLMHGVSFYRFNLINDPSWSISIEFWASLFIPTVFARLNKWVVLISSTIAVLFLLQQTKTGFVSDNLIGLYQFFLAISVMAIGSSIYILFKKYNEKIIFKFTHNEIFLWCCFLTCIFGVYNQTHNNLDFFFIIPFIPLMIIDYIQTPSLIRKFLYSDIMQFAGKISFPLYLIHSAILIAGFQYRIDNKPISIIGTAIVSIFVSYLYYVLIDAPLYIYLKKMINDKLNNSHSIIYVRSNKVK
ncbi:acyltransferase [Sodalis sp. dw_96]|uniref:acyltransferase family protein n=1 Tax=Sodalis sp. dw_96 TaxID=2719794 RepID=UPI001BD5537B|nr:acyltransferase [Sodalis sp. dw_96]